MEQLTKNQAVATSQEAVQNQNEPQLRDENAHNDKSVHGVRSEERFSRNAETDLVCRLLLEKKKDRMKVWTIFNKKIRLYFASPIGYVIPFSFTVAMVLFFWL